MDVSPETWKTVSKLLDEAFDLDSENRAAWLEKLRVTRPDLVPLVRKLLAAHSTSGHADVLSHLPAITLARNRCRHERPGLRRARRAISIKA